MNIPLALRNTKYVYNCFKFQLNYQAYEFQKSKNKNIKLMDCQHFPISYLFFLILKYVCDFVRSSTSISVWHEWQGNTTCPSPNRHENWHQDLKPCLHSPYELG